MVLCVDVDDVICNLQETVIGLFNKRFGSNYSVNDFTDYDVMNVLPTQDGVVLRDMYGEPGLYDKVKPLPGAQDALQKLINMGHQIYLVTAAVPKTYGEKIEFIKRYFPFIDDGHIICMKHKWLFKCDIMIEDNLQTLLTKPYYHRVLLNRPWNQSNKDYVYDIHRCYNWDDIIAAVNKISELE
jgi:5'(3')-deoxyribonucleotidase